MSGRKTQAPKQTSGRERLSRPDLCVATKCHILINHEAGCFDVTMQRATRLELAAFSHENIALHRPSHLHRFCPDLTAYACVLPDRERSSGIDCALHLAVDEQLVQEFDRAFNRNSSGKSSAGLRWHERAVGWPGDDRWVRLIRWRGLGAPAMVGKSVHGENCAEWFGIWEAESRWQAVRTRLIEVDLPDGAYFDGVFELIASTSGKLSDKLVAHCVRKIVRRSDMIRNCNSFF